MKKLMVLAMMMMTSVVAFGQTEVTKFLGIPVDGLKHQMVQKLMTKGFRKDPEVDGLIGEFNGVDVNVYIDTNKNKVWRLMLIDAEESDEANIKNRFNALCAQFNKNKRYVSANDTDYTIGPDVKISYEMSVKKKRFEASYYQDPERVDTAYANKIFDEILHENFSQRQIDHPTKEEAQKMESLLTEASQDIASKKSVWFLIDETYGKYSIVMYYDNEFNHADGEDL